MRPRQLRRTTTRVHGQSSQLILYALQILAETNTQCQCLLLPCEMSAEIQSEVETNTQCQCPLLPYEMSADVLPGVEVNMQYHHLLLPYETAASMCYEGKQMCSVCIRSRSCEGGWNKTWAREDSG